MALRQAIERLKESRALDGLLLPAGSDGGAVAVLQDKVQSIISQAGARLTMIVKVDQSARRDGADGLGRTIEPASWQFHQADVTLRRASGQATYLI